MRATLALAACLVATPALGQFKLQDDLPQLPVDGAVCNEKRTHCLVNFADWMTDHVAIDLAGERLAANAKEIERLRADLEALRKSKRCAVLTPQRNAAIRR